MGRGLGNAAQRSHAAAPEINLRSGGHGAGQAQAAQAAVGLAAVEEPGHGLLADVAALGERDRARVEVSLLGDDRVVEIDSVPGPAALDAQAFGGRLADRRDAHLGQRGGQVLGVGGVAEQVDAGVGADRAQRDVGHLGLAVGVLGLGQVGHRGHSRGVGTDQGDQATLQRALVQLGVEAEAEAADHVEQALQRHALGVERELGARVQDAQIPEHLALGGQERRVAAAAGVQRLDVVGDLALQEALGLRAGEGELAALGAVEHAHRRGDRRVVIERKGRGAHRGEDRPAPGSVLGMP